MLAALLCATSALVAPRSAFVVAPHSAYFQRTMLFTMVDSWYDSGGRLSPRPASMPNTKPSTLADELVGNESVVPFVGAVIVLIGFVFLLSGGVEGGSVRLEDPLPSLGDAVAPIKPIVEAARDSVASSSSAPSCYPYACK